MKKAIQIKKADSSTGKKLSVISFLTCTFLILIGFWVFKIPGAVIFFLVSYSANFYLSFSMKKKALIAYLKIYREKLFPTLFENGEKISKPDAETPMSSLFPEALIHWTACYKKENVSVGFVRIYKGSQEIASGLASVSPSHGLEGTLFKGYFPSLYEEYCDELQVKGEISNKAYEFAKVLETQFESFALCFTGEYSLLFCPCAQDFLSGTITAKDDLSPKALSRQYAYINIARAFEGLDISLAEECTQLLEWDDFDEELHVYLECTKSK